jgi:hypothetical protein
MEQSKKELLERVLLLMKYDNKDTLSENISKVKVLTEQPNPNKVPKNQSDKDAIKNCKMQPRNYNWFAPRTKETVDKFCNSLEMNYPSFYSKVPTYDNPNPQTTQQTTQQKKKYTSEELKKYSIEQLINLYGKEAEGTSKVSFGTNKDNIIKAFAEKVSQMDYNGLVKLVKNNRIFRDSLYYSDSPSGTIQQPRSKDSFKGNVGFWGPLVVLVDYEIFERKLGEYNKNPKQTNYQPPIEPNLKDLIDKFKLPSLKQYQYSPTQYLTKIEQEEKGLKGYNQKGYPEYGNKILDIQRALVQLGSLKEKDISKTYGSNIHYSWYNSLRDYLQSGNYEFGNFLGITNDNPDRMQIIENYICMLKYNGQVCEGSRIDLRKMPIYLSMTDGTGASELILSFLRANAYPNIPADEVLYEKGNKPKDQKEKFEQGVKDSKFLKISIYDVNGKVIPIYSRGDDPDLPTYSLESEGFELPPQTINLGPVFSILTDEQVKTLVDWLSEWCTEPVEVNGVKYGRKIVTEGGRGLNFDNDLFSSFPDFIKQTLENESLYPNCVVDFANKETNGDVGKWMIKFLKLPEDQIDLLLQFYPEDYDLIQTYLPGAPGSKDFYLNSPLVKNAVKMHISKNPYSLGFLSKLSASTTRSGDYPINDITDSMVESTIKQLLTDCPGMNEELKAIASGQRKYKGYIVGQYYDSLPGYINYTIPCPDEWWDENGWKIVMGGVLLVSLVFPPAFAAAGFELELAIVARMSVDIGLNVYSSYRNKMAGNEEAAKIDLACAMLSFIVDTPGFEKKFLGGFGDWAEISVFKKLKDVNPNTGKKMNNFVRSLTDVERRHLYDIINTPRFMRQIQVYGKEIMDRWLKQQFGSQWRNIAVKIFREIGVKLPVLFSPIMLNLGYKMFLYSNQVSQNIFKVPLDETKWKAFEWELKNRGVDTPEEADSFYEMLKNNPNEAKDFVNAVGKKIFGETFEKIKNQISVKTVNEEIKKTEDLIRRIDAVMESDTTKIEE